MFNKLDFEYSLTNGSGDYRIGETVTQWTGINDEHGTPINIEGEVASWEDLGLTTGNLTVVSLTTTDGDFRELYQSTDVTKQVVGTESGTSYDVLLTTEATNYNRDQYADNDNFDYEADSIIDFSETNPFGMP